MWRKGSYKMLDQELANQAKHNFTKENESKSLMAEQENCTIYWQERNKRQATGKRVQKFYCPNGHENCINSNLFWTLYVKLLIWILLINLVALYNILYVLKDNLILSTSNMKHFYKSIDLNINDEQWTWLHSITYCMFKRTLWCC